jgi:predicted restriction endonuclease
MDLSKEFHPAPKAEYKRKVPKRGDRSKFTGLVRQQVKEHFNHTCQMCGGHGYHVHHVEPRGSGKGRGVFTNALLLCASCHKKIHADDKLLRY